jgi:hypothetical protein
MDTPRGYKGRIAIGEIEEIVQSYVFASIVLTLMRVARNWSDFQRLLALAFPSR